MRFSVLGDFKRNLGRGVAIVVLGGLAAGCSSSAQRFGGVDDLFTASTANQKSIIRPASQPYPGDVATSLDAAPTGSVNRAAITPPRVDSSTVTTAALEPVGRKPLGSATASGLDHSATGSVPAAAAVEQAMPAAIEEPAGWSRAGGTQVTARSGETIYNLSRRFGVPANVIAKVNGLPENSQLTTGQKLVIPTYVYSNKAPVSAPDSNPAVADAKSSRGTKYDVPTDKVPLPSAPGERTAVLPASPKVRDGEKAAPAETSTATASAQETGTYKVQAGDTLSKIAKKTGVSAAKLKSANGLQDGVLRIGQKLKVPGGSEQVVAEKGKPELDQGTVGTVPAKPGKASEVAGYTPPKKADKAIEQESAEAAPDATGIGRMRWPVKGRVVSGYGSGGGKKNDGIDIAVPEGTAVKAAENGVVIYAGDGLKEFGNTVLVRHENGLVTVYGHNSDLKVTRGQKVKRGEQIATSGMSGSASSPMLHFEVRKDSAPVDPSGFLN
ncbi:MAG: peptidoglycan DD-metalloendopeptidase family protein [Rhizobiaceae bacterium]